MLGIWDFSQNVAMAQGKKNKKLELKLASAYKSDTPVLGVVPYYLKKKI